MGECVHRVGLARLDGAWRRRQCPRRALIAGRGGRRRWQRVEQDEGKREVGVGVVHAVGVPLHHLREGVGGARWGSSEMRSSEMK